MKDRLSAPPLSFFRLPAAAAILLMTFLGSIVSEGQQAGGTQLPPLATGDLPEVIARIDGDPISQRELIAQARTMRMQSIQAGSGDPGQSDRFLPMVLNALISERLVYADSQTRGVGPSEAEIEQRVVQVIETYGGEEAFEKALVAQGLDRPYVRRQVAQTLSFDKMMEGEIKPTIEISEEAIKDYYERFKDQMKVPTTYKLRRIVKQVPGEAGAEAKQAAHTQLEALRRQVIGGADFAALAKEHSDDVKTRDQGGEMPWIVLTGRGGRFEPVVSKLEVGELADVVETEAGIFLIRLEDRKAERLKTLDEARQEIGNILAVSEARQEIQRRVERLRADAEVEILM